jgi:hypothetical protein
VYDYGVDVDVRPPPAEEVVDLTEVAAGAAARD